MNRVQHIRLVCLCLLLQLALPASSEERQLHQVQDLPYGVALFHFFQDKHFSAITDLLVAAQRRSIVRQGADPELLLGGLYLSYGMHKDASPIFERLIDDATPAGTRDRAWFNLAKLQYQRGHLAKAEQSLTRIQGSLPAFREAERWNLLANIHLQQQRYDDAIRTLQAFRGESTWQAYARFNTGVALVRQGRLKEGIAYLTTVGTMEPGNQEQKALRDKANVALGFAQMKFKHPEGATRAFSRVRLQGPQSNMALLGSGWAWNSRKDFEKALVPWLELKTRSPLDPAVQESLLAIPYTFEQLGKPKLALVHYNRANQSLDTQLAELDRIIRAVNDGELIRALTPANLGDETALSVYAIRLPDSITAPYLSAMMASHGFQAAMQNYQDLLYLRYVLDRWQRDLPTFDLMLRERRAVYNRKLPSVTRDERLQLIRQFRQQRDRLAARVAGLEQHPDLRLLASSEEQELLDTLDDIRTALQRLAGSRDLSAQQDRYRLLQGILHWNIATDYVPRLWQLKKSLRQLDTALREAAAQHAALRATWQQAPASFAGFARRIQGQDQRIHELQRKVEAALGKQQQYIQQLALTAIKHYRQRLKSYQVRARFAQARLYDTLAKAGEVQ